MKKLFLPLVAATALLTGCLVTSVYPFYNTTDLAFEPALLGNWSNIKEPGEHWNFEPDGTNAYRFTYSSDGKASTMQAHLFRLGGQLFLDMVTTEEKDEIQPPPIPAHALLRVSQLAPNVRMAPMDYDWLKELLAKEPKALRHHIAGAVDKTGEGRIVLTADTSELQKFIAKHLKTDAAWKEDLELKRDAASAKAEPAEAK